MKHTHGPIPDMLDPVTPVTDDVELDALRAVTHHHNHIRPLPLGDVRTVLEALGLVDDSRRGGHRDVRREAARGAR